MAILLTDAARSFLNVKVWLGLLHAFTYWRCDAYAVAASNKKSPDSEKEGSVKINKKCTFLPSFVGSFCCNCRNGLWLSVHKGERHAKQ